MLLSFISVDVIAYPQVQPNTFHRVGGGVGSMVALRTQRVEQIAETVQFRKFWLLAATVTPRMEPFQKTYNVKVTQLVETPYE